MDLMERGMGRKGKWVKQCRGREWRGGGKEREFISYPPHVWSLPAVQLWIMWSTCVDGYTNCSNVLQQDFV